LDDYAYVLGMGSSSVEAVPPAKAVDRDAVWHNVQGFRSLQADGYAVNETGEFNQVLLVDGAHEAVIKIPYTTGLVARYRVHIEGWALSELEMAPSPPPLEIPHIFECSESDPPYYLALNYLRGEALPREIIEHFSSVEQRRLGQKIGQFVAWAAANLSLDVTPKAAVYKTAYSYDKLDRLWLAAHATNELTDYPELLEILNDLWIDHFDWRSVSPTIVGHDDIRPDNIIFRQEQSLWLPSGIIDFGLTKPTTPERELRHIWAMGGELATAAVIGYEKASGSMVSHAGLNFWARLQTAVGCANCVLYDRPASVSHFAQRLKNLYPNTDWSELEANA
jgi:hypothetical protein